MSGVLCKTRCKIILKFKFLLKDIPGVFSFNRKLRRIKSESFMPIPANYTEFMFLPASTILVPKIFSNICWPQQSVLHSDARRMWLWSWFDCYWSGKSWETLCFVRCLETPLTHGKISVVEWKCRSMWKETPMCAKEYNFYIIFLLALLLAKQLCALTQNVHQSRVFILILQWLSTWLIQSTLTL